MKKFKIDYSWTAHQIKASLLEVGRIRQFIELVVTNEEKAKELMDTLVNEKPLHKLAHTETGWTVADRGFFLVRCSDEAWAYYVKDFIAYIRNCGTKQTCVSFLSHMEELKLVSSCKLPITRKSKDNDAKKSDVVEKVLTGPERIRLAAEKLHQQKTVAYPVAQEEPKVTMEIPKEEPCEVVEKPQVDEPQKDVTITVDRDDLLRVIKHFNEGTPIPHKSVYRLMYKILQSYADV